MKAMMDKPHTISFEDKLNDDFVVEPTHHAVHRSGIAKLIRILLLLCVLLAVIWLVYGKLNT
ncbi:MAG: hypothetical protein ABSD98_07480 [Candidatus Korobacteraceae bacterium]|jgi:hypothetical protein